jgi:PKHD-type hydroxylase
MKHLWYYHINFFSLKEIKELNKTVLKTANKNEVDRPSLESKKNCDVHISNYGEVKHILYKLEEFLKFTNTNIFGFELYPFDNYQHVFLNTYSFDKDGRYDYHYDGHPHNEIFTTKITMLINTSEEKYEGGEFCIFEGKEKEIKEYSKPGSILLFPSFLFHAVKPVTKGIRKSIALWAAGPHWR